MSKLVVHLLYVFFIWVKVLSCSGLDVEYSTGASVVQGKLNVHLVPHSHDDVGWLKTVDQYYVGSNNSIQGACVRNVLDSVVDALLRDQNRKFAFAEMAFFQRWWYEQDHKTRERARNLVNSGRLELVNGGWSMHDEATTHYIDMIDQTTLGHSFIKKHFNVTPRAGWQIDPFGHSAVQAYLLGAELGFDSVHFARIDYQDRGKRKAHKSLEVVWRGSKTFGSSSQIFAITFFNDYGPPQGFDFEVNSDSQPLQDNPHLYDYNVKQRVDDFVASAFEYANVTRTNHVMWTMGNDFRYQYAETWFKQMDKFINYVNKDGRVNALYSTPSIYVDAKRAADQTWPLKTDDYFPYADMEGAYWTGYFTSRPAFKRYVRLLGGYSLVARQLEFMFGKKMADQDTYSLQDALGIAQHHDAVTGTAKQHTTNDYIKRLAVGANKAEAVVNSALSCLTKKTTDDKCEESHKIFSQCPLLNISYCPATEANIPDGKSLVLVAYNPLGWNRTKIIRLPVGSSDLTVEDSMGSRLETQFIPLDNVTKNLRTFNTKAYLGFSPKQIPKFWLIFEASVPPLGWKTFFLSKSSGKDNANMKSQELFVEMNTKHDENVDIGNGNVKMSFSSRSGRLNRISNSRTGVDMTIEQDYLWYASSMGNDNSPQFSGAYIFRPGSSQPMPVANSVEMKVIRGPLVDEVHQQFDTWIYQVVRLCKDKEHAEFEYTIGPLPLDNIGKEVITRLTTKMETNKVFYTDSNGRDFLKRVRDYREDWPLSVNEPVAGNYYPLNLGIYTTDNRSELSILVDRATGGASIVDGEVELMLHRRIMFDDSRGVKEPLNEEVCSGLKCEGLTIRGHYYVSANRAGDGARWRRQTGQEIYSPLLLAFTLEAMENWKSSRVTDWTLMSPKYSLPRNVALITLQELEGRSVLLRLAHLYEAHEDKEYSKLARVYLKKLFAGKTIRGVTETSLSANQERAKMKKINWKVEGETKKTARPIKGGPVDGGTLAVELGPMEIRTFLLEF